MTTPSERRDKPACRNCGTRGGAHTALDCVDALRAKVSTLAAKVERLEGAARKIVGNRGCQDPDCCQAAIDQESARQELAALLPAGSSAQDAGEK
jgi:methionine synthase II (cobalamin-independent)